MGCITSVDVPNAHCFADDTQLYLSFDPNSPTDQAMALEAMERCISDLRKRMYRSNLCGVTNVVNVFPAT